MVFLAMNSIDISEEAKVLTVITTNFVERLYEDAIEQKRKDEVKGYENHGFDTNSKPSWLFKVKGYDEENRRKLSYRRKLVLRE